MRGWLAAASGGLARPSKNSNLSGVGAVFGPTQPVLRSPADTPVSDRRTA